MIYFAQLDSGAIKIGFTENLDQRIRDLRAEFKSAISLLATMPGDKRTERELQKRFSDARFGETEQFRPTHELMEFIGKPLLVSPNPDTIEQQIQREPVISLRPDPDTVRRLKELAAIMGPIKPLTTSDVVRECVRRVHETETSTKTREKRR